MMYLYLICENNLNVRFLFFSSRRGHTRSTRDWSSDVCSSDLALGWEPDRSLAGLMVAPSKRQQSNGQPGAASAGDPYVPTHGNGGYRVASYELELDYRVSSNRLNGKALITAVATQDLSRISFDLSGLRVSKVSVNGRRAQRYTHRSGKLHVWADIVDGAEFTVDIQYGGSPEPEDSPWGDLGWEELTEGVIVASQPSGAATWFPCNDHPGDKAHYRISITTDSPYYVVANGRLVSRRVKASRTTWVFDQAAPMASYLATVQIGRYDIVELASAPVT